MEAIEKPGLGHLRSVFFQVFSKAKIVVACYGVNVFPKSSCIRILIP